MIHGNVGAVNAVHKNTDFLPLGAAGGPSSNRAPVFKTHGAVVGMVHGESGRVSGRCHPSHGCQSPMGSEGERVLNVGANGRGQVTGICQEAMSHTVHQPTVIVMPQPNQPIVGTSTSGWGRAGPAMRPWWETGRPTSRPTCGASPRLSVLACICGLHPGFLVSGPRPIAAEVQGTSDCNAVQRGIDEGFCCGVSGRIEEWGNESIDARAGQRLALSLQFIAVRKHRRPLAF